MRTSQENIGQEIEARGWCCGAVVPREMYPEILKHLQSTGARDLPATISDDDWLIVLTQTCDVVARKIDDEPGVELLWAHQIPALREDFKNRRSTRQLDFRPDPRLHSELCLTVHASIDRHVIPRALLALHRPRTDRALIERGVNGLLSWYTLRYTRPAWPQEFVNHVNACRDKLKKALKKLPHPEDHSELRITTPQVKQGRYHVAIFLVLDEEEAKEPKYRETAQLAFNTFTAALTKADQIEVDELSGVKMGNEFSWQLMQMTHSWNFASLTPIE